MRPVTLPTVMSALEDHKCSAEWRPRARELAESGTAALEKTEL
jgi:hypothetical protein